MTAPRTKPGDTGHAFSHVYQCFFHDGEVTEIRAYGLRGKSNAWDGFAFDVVFGYFDNAKDFGQAAAAIEAAKAPGIYFTLNPATPNLLARACNRLKASGRKPTQTTDHDIQAIRWLPIDIDPKRPAGISSTDDELKAAIETRNNIHKWLKKEFGLEPIPAVSGNGTHLLVRLPDLPNTEENKHMIKQGLQAIAAKFGTNGMDIDLSVFNPSRIWKLYGTTARKGDNIPARPHRKSCIPTEFLKKATAT